MTKYCALLDTGELAYLGEFSAFWGASEFCDEHHPNTVWILSQEDLEAWTTTLEKMRSPTFA